jgi:hypothetical protein
MFRVKTTRRNVKRALSPLKPATDLPFASAPVADPAIAPLPTNMIVEVAARAPPPAIIGAAATIEKQDKQMTDLFAAEAAFVFLTKPWLRLERGMRMQKLRVFADNYEGLSVEDKDNLYKYLVRANDAKLLNTKQQLAYEGGTIQAIKGLKIIRTGDPTEAATFKIEGSRATKRNTSND